MLIVYIKISYMLNANRRREEDLSIYGKYCPESNGRWPMAGPAV
jgi:hypothetical protein